MTVLCGGNTVVCITSIRHSDGTGTGSNRNLLDILGSRTSHIPSSGSSGLAAELSEFVQGKMAGYKRPRAFVEVSTIPRLPNGKADYKAAKMLAEERLP